MWPIFGVQLIDNGFRLVELSPGKFAGAECSRVYSLFYNNRSWTTTFQDDGNDEQRLLEPCGPPNPSGMTKEKRTHQPAGMTA